uniref:Ig-like domain-containing protein n=1 Tax=Pygocentrus nattereri TaxID=42514 RepID=A0AAR2KDR9_PYGNA
MEFGSLSVILLQIVFLHCGQTQDEPGSDSDAPGSENNSSVYTGSVTLICEERSTGWKFLWHKSSLQPQSPTDEDSSTFRVTVSDEETAEFTCAARKRDYSTQTSDPVETTVKVLIVLGHCGQTQKKSKGKETRETENHREPEGEEHQSSVCTGDTVTLICEVESTGWEFLWRKGSPQLQPQSTEDKGTNTVDVTVSDEETTKTKCAALRGDYSTQLSDPAKITIKEKPNLTVSVGPQSSVYTGDTITLTCKVKQSTGWEFLWYNGSQQLQPLNTADKDTNTVSVTVSDEGTAEFRCEAHRGIYYTQLSDQVMITVKERPRAVVSIKPDDQVFRGETVTLRCDIQGGGVSNWQYSWFKDSSSIPVSNEQQYRISSVRKSDIGTYTCRGTESGTSRSSHTSDAVTLTVTALLTATLTVEPKRSPVFTGESVTLKCEIQSHSDWRYQWYKGSSRTAVSQSQTNTFTIRSAADQGQYWCRGERDNRPSSSQRSNNVTLTVTERPKAAVSIQPDNQVFRGETVTLRCDIQGGGVSNWQYSWFKDGSSIPVSNEQQYSISSVTESHRGKYTCSGTERGTSRSSHTSDAVTLTVSALLTATVTVEPKWSPVFTGESVTLKCEIQSHSDWRYQWYKGSSRTAVSQSQTNTFTIRSAADQGQYWCRGERDYRPSSSQRSNNVTLTVTERPKAAVSIQPDNQVFRGETVTLRCDIQGEGVSNWQYSWFKGDPYRRVSNEQQYRISSVTVSHSGTYTCSGTERGTSRYSHTSEAVTLTVSERPKAAVSIQPDEQVFRGETITLRCDIQGGGVSNWQYSWFKDGSSTPVSNEQQYTISSVTASHGGTYTCRGTVRGTSRYSHTSQAVTLTVSALPTATLTVEPRWSPVFTGESVTLKCEIQSHSNWRYQWYKGSRRTAVSQSLTNTFTIRSAAYQDQDQYWCRGERDNRPTSSQPSNTVTLRVKERPRAVVSIQPDDQVFSGETVTLRCDIQGGGVSNWQYSWIKDGSSTPISNEQQYSITSVTESDGGTYNCRGTERGTSRYSHTSDAVTLTVSALPTATLTVEPRWSPVFTGESVTLKCEINSYSYWRYHYDWRYQWYKGSSRTAVNQSQTNTFTIRSAADQDQYWCRGERDYRPTSSQDSNTVTLTVKALPTATLTVEPRWSPAFTGESVTLKCEIDSYSDWRYQWYNWRYKWYKGSSRTAVYQSHTNIITIGLAADQDQYWCRGERDYRPTSSQDSNTVILTVTERPRAVVSIEPDDQVFSGENVTLRCDIQGGGVSNWQYSWYIDGSSTPVSNEQQYNISSVTASHRGTYTCRGTERGTSRYSHTSEAVTLTVSEKPKPELTSSHKVAGLIGNPMVLYCKLDQSAGWRFYWSKHTQSPENETKTETHSYTISSVSVSDGGQYWCRAGRGTPVYYTHYSDALWINVTGVSPEVSLMVSPSRTQHFITDSLSLSCEGQSNSTGWRVRQYTHSEVSDCLSGWGSITGSTCNISSLSTSHTGVYWCDSESGESSNFVNITVTNGAVILDSPVHPVTEGDPLTLRCLYRDPKPSNLPAEFYKNGSLLQTQTTGEMTIRTVSKSDEGLYHCKHPEKGESPQSWISVRGSNRVTVILAAVALSLILFLIVMLCLICCYKKKKGNKKNTSQTSGQSQNTGSTLLQPGNDHIYGNVGVMANTTTDDSAAGSSDTTYAQVLSTKKKPNRKGGSAAGCSDATYVQVMSTEKKLKANDDSAAGSSDTTYAQVLSTKKKPKRTDVAVTTPNDLTYSQIQMKHLKSHSEDDVMPEPSDTIYSQIQEKNKKLKGKGASKYSEAEPSDVTYAELDLKDKKPMKNQVKGKSREEADTVYSQLKTKTHLRLRSRAITPGWSLKTAVKFLLFAKREKVSYTWSGYKTGSGAELRLTPSPAEGDVTLTCTAANSYSNNTKTTKVTCNPSLCVRADENTVTEHRDAGSSLTLPLGHPKENVSYAQWRYEGKTFAVYIQGQVRITDELQFSGRLKVDSDHLSVEVTDLQLQDSGSYSISADKSGAQLPTKIISLTVYAECFHTASSSFSVCF